MEANTRDNMATAVASFKSPDELEITYPETAKTAKEKKKMKEDMLREHPETLLSDYMGADGDKTLCNLLFYTSDPTAWHTTLCSEWECVKKGGISKGRQIVLEDLPDFKVTINLYHNGTVMVQGTEGSLISFQRQFKDLKKRAMTSKKDQAGESAAVSRDEAGLPNQLEPPSSYTPSDANTKSSSPDNLRLRDTLVALEQDYIMFKEKILLNLQQAQPERILMLQSAVKQLEEDNQGLRHEVKTLKEKMLKMEQRFSNSLLENNNTATPDKAHYPRDTNLIPVSALTPVPAPCIQDRPPKSHQRDHITPNISERNLRASGSTIFSASRPDLPVMACLPDQPPHINHHQTTSESSLAPSPSVTSHNQQSTGPASLKMKTGNIYILCDSNGNHLDQRRLFPKRTVKKLWCPTTQKAKDIIQRGALTNPSHIIIHTGTNDLKVSTSGVAKSLIDTIKMANQSHPDAKVIISSLLPRRDISERVIEEINEEVSGFCANVPNVEVATHNNINTTHLYDNVHINKNNIRLFAKNIKDAALSRDRIPSQVGNDITKVDHNQHSSHRPTYASAASRCNSELSQLTQIRSMLQHLCDNLLH